VSLIETHFCSRAGETDLLARLQARRPGAFEELLDLYQQPLYRFVFRLLEDPSETADVTQEVFIKVFLKLGDFRGDCSLKTWLYRIAVREASNRRRWFRRHRRPEASYDPAEGVDGAEPGVFVDRSDTPFDVTYRHEQMALIENALRGMDRRLRLAVILRDIEELSYNEIAEVMQVSLGTVKSRILRGRDALRAALQEQMPAEATEAVPLRAE
jgi:RNA polymerase sigma-70 factor (ECF subfamily)